MNDLAKVLSTEDLHNLKRIAVEMEKYILEVLTPIKSTLSNDWRRAKDLLSKIAHDHKKVDEAVTKTELLIKQLNSIMGVIK